MKKLFVLLAMALATCNLFAKSDFVQVKDGHFVRDGKPYYYVGTKRDRAATGNDSAVNLTR